MTIRGYAITAWFTSSADWTITIVCAVAVLTVGWVIFHVHRERQRRQHVDAVRDQLVHRPSVAELRAKCSADTMARYPTTPAALNGRAAAQGGRSHVSRLES